MFFQLQFVALLLPLLVTNVQARPTPTPTALAALKQRDLVDALPALVDWAIVFEPSRPITTRDIERRAGEDVGRFKCPYPGCDKTYKSNQSLQVCLFFSSV